MQDMERLGVTPDNAYMYIQGHHLFDSVVTPLLYKVCSKLQTERETQIRKTARHGLQMRNEMSSYTRSTENITTMLRRNTGYSISPQFKQIIKDVENMLNGELYTTNLEDKTP